MTSVKRARTEGGETATTATATAAIVVNSAPMQFDNATLRICGVRCDVGGAVTACHYSRAWWLIPKRTEKSKRVVTRGKTYYLCEVDALEYIGFCANCSAAVPKGTKPLTSSPTQLWGACAANESVAYLCGDCASVDEKQSTRPFDHTERNVKEKARHSLSQLRTAMKEAKTQPPEWELLINQIETATASELIQEMLVNYKKSNNPDRMTVWHSLFHQLSLRLLKKKKW